MENLGKKGTILIVDDEQVVLDVATLMVEKLGYQVLQAQNGTEALQVFTGNKDAICLVILDMKLPDESGSDICKRLKDINPTVRILHTTGFGKNAGTDVLDCGCNSCLPKPFKFEQLSDKLNELTRAQGR